MLQLSRALERFMLTLSSTYLCLESSDKHEKCIKTLNLIQALKCIKLFHYWVPAYFATATRSISFFKTILPYFPTLIRFSKTVLWVKIWSTYTIIHCVVFEVFVHVYNLSLLASLSLQYHHMRSMASQMTGILTATWMVCSVYSDEIMKAPKKRCFLMKIPLTKVQSQRVRITPLWGLVQLIMPWRHHGFVT